MTLRVLNRRHFIKAAGASMLLPNAAWPQTRDVEGGIGGTGIVGVLTDFGSLIVGGRRVELDANTQFTNGFGTISERDLTIGESLTVEAAGASPDLIARRVHVTHPVVGRVNHVSENGRELSVNGATVFVRNGRFSVGQRVAVSGLWQGNHIIASAVRGAGSSLDLVSGTVIREQRKVRIGAVELQGTGARQLEEASFATAIGLFVPGQNRLVVNEIVPGRFTGAAGPLQHLAIEGYLEPISEAPGYRIAGLGHSFERNLQLDAYKGSRNLFLGDYTGLFAVKQGLVLPDDFDQRRRVLREVAGG